MDKRTEKKLVGKPNSNQIEVVFCPYIFLNIFTLPQVLDKARQASMLCANEQSLNDFFQGYKLAIISALHLYIDNVIRDPSIIGLKVDPNFYDYWAFSKDRGKDKLKAVVRPNHAVSALMARVQSLFNMLLEVESLEDLSSCLGPLQDFSSSLRRIFVKHYASFEKSGDQWVSIEPEQSLCKRAPDILWAQLMNFKTLRGIYSEVYLSHRPERPNGMDDPDLSNDSVMTELDHEPFESFGISPLPDRWVPGYSFVMCESLRTLSSPQLLSDLSELLDHGKAIQNWLDFNKFSLKLIKPLSSTPNWSLPGSQLLFKKKGQIPARERRTVMLPVPRGTNIEQVRAILGNAAQTVEVESPSAPLNFRCLLDGAVIRSKRTKEKVQVAEIRHPVGGGKFDYSFAIFMPAYGGQIFAMNVSKWWVFFDICSDFSDGASKMLGKIRESLQEHKKDIKVLRIKVAKEAFADICADTGFRYLRHEIDDMKRMDSETRGVFPELLLVTYLGAEGAHPIKPRFKPSFLKGKELDVIGVNWDGESPSEVIIFESKGRAIHDKDLQGEINRFGNKIEIVKKNLKELANELDIPYKKNVKLKTIFVSMYDLKKFVFEVPAGITIWDFGRFQEELERVGVSSDYRDLLRRKILAHLVVSFNDRSFLDGFFGEEN